MECRDAQFYLRLRRHAADELGHDLTGALEGHLAVCKACAADARAAASFDRAVASAMKAVPVPTGLREKLFTQAAAKQGAVLRRKLIRVAGVCAATLLLCGIALGVFSNNRPKPSADDYAQRAEQQATGAQEAVGQFLKDQKLPDRLPRPFDYRLLVHYATEEIKGRKVAVFVFKSPFPEDNGFAKVYVFPTDGGFDLSGLQDVQGSNVRVLREDGKDQFRGATYLFVHTGRDLTPFLVRGGPVL